MRRQKRGRGVHARWYVPAHQSLGLLFAMEIKKKRLVQTNSCWFSKQTTTISQKKKILLFAPVMADTEYVTRCEREAVRTTLSCPYLTESKKMCPGKSIFIRLTGSCLPNARRSMFYCSQCDRVWDQREFQETQIKLHHQTHQEIQQDLTRHRIAKSSVPPVSPLISYTESPRHHASSGLLHLVPDSSKSVVDSCSNFVLAPKSGWQN